MASDLPISEIDFVILADRAEAINGKLYVMGGGWDRLDVPDLSQPVTFGFAVGVLIPWNATNENHPLQIILEHEDGEKVGREFNVTVNVGRPPTAIPGQSFRAIIAVNGRWTLPRSGTYRVVAALPSGEPKRTVFHAIQQPGSRVVRPSGQP